MAPPPPTAPMIGTLQARSRLSSAERPPSSLVHAEGADGRLDRRLRIEVLADPSPPHVPLVLAAPLRQQPPYLAC